MLSIEERHGSSKKKKEETLRSLESKIVQQIYAPLKKPEETE